ncbi:hypothetical protein V5F77_00010 [Xanthobacter sp. DSM 24535]|uniref:hypothetical protein n=1 Tax=Roseixanthobacter psychrophilus TaxID=3119917 RepID=UPI00372AF1B2
MTNVKEVKQLLAPLLDRRHDLALIGRLVVIKPVRHFLRGVFVERTVYARACDPRWLVMKLYRRYDDISLSPAQHLFRKDKKPWLLDLPDTSEMLCDAVEVQIQEMSSRGDDIDTYIDKSTPRSEAYLKYYGAAHALDDIALGDLDSARDLISTYESAAHVWLPHLKRLGLDEKLLALGNKLSLEDRVTLAGLLHEWEAYSVEKLKLGKIWERTPFPLETAPGPNA